MTDDDRTPWLELLIAYRYWIGALASITLIGAIAWVWIHGLPEVEIPQWVTVFTFGAIVAAALGALPAAMIVDWLYDPPKRYLVQPGLTADEAAIYELNPDTFEDLTVYQGSLPAPGGPSINPIQPSRPSIRATRVLASWPSSV